MKTKRKIAIICSSRATYGYKRRIIKLIHESSELEALIIVTGMHLIPEYGLTLREIERDEISISAKVDMMVGGDTPTSWAKSIGVEITSLAQVFSMLEPDMVLVTGDRAEMFAAAACAAYMNIPVAHIQSGDRSGHIDGSARHAITKLSHVHFPSCKDSEERVAKMGEEQWRVHNVGAPQLDEIIYGEKLSINELNEIFGLNLEQKTILVIQHTVLVENDLSYTQIIETLEAIKLLKMQTIIIYPNVDSGGQEIIKAINEYKKLPFIHTFKNLERKVFISLLANVSVLVGNSSSGILEAPSFKLPVVNIGDRQRDRMQAENVLNVPHKRSEIVKAVKRCLFGKEYRLRLKKCENPYGDGCSSERIVEILKEINIDEKLLDKIITY